MAEERGHRAEAVDLVLRRPGVGGLGLGEPGIERVAEAAELDDGVGVGRHLRRLDGLSERVEHEVQPTKHQFDRQRKTLKRYGVFEPTTPVRQTCAQMVRNLREAPVSEHRYHVDGYSAAPPEVVFDVLVDGPGWADVGARA